MKEWIIGLLAIIIFVRRRYVIEIIKAFKNSIHFDLNGFVTTIIGLHGIRRKKMTLYEVCTKNKSEIDTTVWDKDYDIEVYFPNEANDKWDEAMLKIAKKLEVVEITKNGVTVNLSEVIEANIDNGVFDKLFINNDIDSIMDDIMNIFAGGVSEEWIIKFADSLKEA